MTELNAVLSQLSDLQTRLSNQEATIASLKLQVERGHSVSPMRLSVPLNDGRPHGPRRDLRDLRDHRDPRIPRVPRDPHIPRVPRDPRDRVSSPYPTLGLSDVIHKNELVTIEIKTGLVDGVQSYSTALALFDGVNLQVTECNLVESLVGLKSSKPGEILYKFMEALKEGGHIKNTFGIAPWRLCFVERNGVRVSLEELRATVG